MTRMLGLRASPERMFESLYRRHVADVYRYALVMLDSPADAEDVTQTTFLNAYRALVRGERPRAAGSWLRVIAHNLCLQHFRQAARRPPEVELEDDAAELVGDEQGVRVDDLIRSVRMEERHLSLASSGWVAAVPFLAGAVGMFTSGAVSDLMVER